MLVFVHSNQRLERLLEDGLLVSGLQMILNLADHMFFDAWIAAKVCREDAGTLSNHFDQANYYALGQAAV